MFKFNYAIPTRFFMADGDGGDPSSSKDSDKTQKSAGKTFTQDDVDKAVKDRLERERKKYSDYDDLKKAKEELDALKAEQLSELDRTKADLEKAQAAAKAADEKVKALELSALKAKLVAEAGLPAALADRVNGDDEEAIKADIETLKPLVKSAAKAVGGGGTPPMDKPDPSAGDYGRNLAKSMFDKSEGAKKASESFFKL